MPELGIVEKLIPGVVKQLKRRANLPVGVLRLRYGPGLTEKAIRQAFQIKSAGTPPEGARLEFEQKIVMITCDCGDAFTPHFQDSPMPYAICQECHKVHPIPGFHHLEAVDVR
jgi:Zn finger protein HypA/HybF involved in hydrogenase expression